MYPFLLSIINKNFQCVDEFEDHIKEFEKEQRQKGIIPHDEKYNKRYGYCLGGSQLSTLFNENQYKTYNELIEEIGETRKRGSKAPTIGNSICGWGNAFEDGVREYLKYLLGCKEIYFNNVCIMDIPGVPYFRYSPDGVAVVNYTKEGELWTTKNHPSEIAGKKCMLIEIKCPLLRTITDEVPRIYKSQVQAGLVALNGLAKEALFVPAKIRLCMLQQLIPNQFYCMRYHTKDGAWPRKCHPLAMGIMDVCRVKSTGMRCEPIDYCTQPESINGILEQINERTLVTKLNKFIVVNGEEKIENIICPQHDLECIGYLGFKIFDIRIITVEENPTFRNELVKEIELFFKSVDDYCS